MKRNKYKLALFLLIFGVLSSQEDCNDGYTLIDVLPETATILSGDSCLYNDDIEALFDLKVANNLVNDVTALEVGNQTWSQGRLTQLVADYTPSGSNGVQT